MGPYHRTPKSGDKAIRYSGLGVRSMGPVGDFLDHTVDGENHTESTLPVLVLYIPGVTKLGPLFNSTPE